MQPNDKTQYRKGQFITGDAYPGVAKIDGHIVYGQRLKPKTSLAEIEARLEAAQRRLDEIVAAVRRR